MQTAARKLVVLRSSRVAMRLKSFNHLARPVFRRRVDPAPAGFQHGDNPADHARIVDPRLAPRVSGEVRRNLRKLGVGQPKTVGNHGRFLSEAVNHDAWIVPSILWVWTLDVV